MLKQIIHLSHLHTMLTFRDKISSTWMSTIRFLSEEVISALVLKDVPDDSDVGYILEVDLHYPTSLHNRHDGNTLAPEPLVIDRNMYSPTQQSVFPVSAPQIKLTQFA